MDAAQRRHSPAGESVCLPGRTENPAGLGQLWEWVDNPWSRGVYELRKKKNLHGFLEVHGALIKV